MREGRWTFSFGVRSMGDGAAFSLERETIILSVPESSIIKLNDLLNTVH